jgi:hypothetical protein
VQEGFVRETSADGGRFRYCAGLSAERPHSFRTASLTVDTSRVAVCRWCKIQISTSKSVRPRPVSASRAASISAMRPVLRRVLASCGICASQVTPRPRVAPRISPVDP